MAPSVELELADAVAEYYADPLGFVLFAFPWGEPGPLWEYAGPDEWQREVLEEVGRLVKERRFDGVHPVDAIREAVSSGHGIGKSVLVAMLAAWILSTRPNSRGTVTANTFVQLETKTWATIVRWMKMCITAHWFEFGTDKIWKKGAKESWFLSAQTCKEENSEAFAGQHAADSTSYYIFDEASAIPEKIWEVAEGGLTDGEPMWLVFGNPTRNSGKFHRIVFGSERSRWKQRIIDSRTCSFTNKAQIEQWVQDYGEDSDFVRVRVRGLAPRASDLQFIDSDRVYGAQHRPASALPDDPLICGLDIARGGSDNCVFRFRRGGDARSLPAIKVSGEQARDSMRLVSTAADILARTFNGTKVAMMFCDETGVGGPIVDRLRQLGHVNVQGVQFGGQSPEKQYANMRAYMWAKMRDWLDRGAIDKDPVLETDLTGPGYAHDKQDRLVLEAKEKMKDRGLSSPDDGDALALTFARHVAVAPMVKREKPRHISAWS